MEYDLRMREEEARTQLDLARRASQLKMRAAEEELGFGPLGPALPGGGGGALGDGSGGPGGEGRRGTMAAAAAAGAAAAAAGSVSSGLEAARAHLRAAQEMDAAALGVRHEEAVAALGRDRDAKVWMSVGRCGARGQGCKGVGW